MAILKMPCTKVQPASLGSGGIRLITVIAISATNSYGKLTKATNVIKLLIDQDHYGKAKEKWQQIS